MHSCSTCVSLTKTTHGFPVNLFPQSLQHRTGTVHGNQFAGKGKCISSVLYPKTARISQITKTYTLHQNHCQTHQYVFIYLSAHAYPFLLLNIFLLNLQYEKPKPDVSQEGTICTQLGIGAFLVIEGTQESSEGNKTKTGPKTAYFSTNWLATALCSSWQGLYPATSIIFALHTLDKRSTVNDDILSCSTSKVKGVIQELQQLIHGTEMPSYSINMAEKVRC